MILIYWCYFKKIVYVENIYIYKNNWKDKIIGIFYMYMYLLEKNLIKQIFKFRQFKYCFFKMKL